jgi:hypothetical protein
VSEADGTPIGTLSAVSCASPTACVAVGRPGASTQADAAVWNGDSWSVAPVPDPPGSTNILVNGISCVSATDCMAVGESLPASTPLVELWNGTAWTVGTVPIPANTEAELTAVSCTSSTYCMAVGNFTQNYLPIGPLAEIWNGTAWAIAALPTTEFPLQSSLSCTGPAQCAVVGSTEAGSSLALGWNGSAWTSESFAAPAGALASALSSVSCPTSADCTAVGSYSNAASSDLPLVEAWNGTAWTIQSAPAPTHVTSSSLGAVSCSSTSSCLATGNSVSLGQVDLPLVESGP